MEIQVNLDSTKYDELLRCLFILKDICNDVDIRNGFIRQRSNDSPTVFEIDLTPIIGEISLPITILKSKLDIFKYFTNQEVSIIALDKKFIIDNNRSSIEFQYPDLSFLDNKYISPEELSRVIITNYDDLILTTQVSKDISELIKGVSSSFHVNSLQVVFSGNTASVSTLSQSKDSFAGFIKNIIVNKELDHVANLIVTPFIIDHDGDINFEMYDIGSNVVINTFSTTIGNVNINLYSRASLKEKLNKESGNEE